MTLKGALKGKDMLVAIKLDTAPLVVPGMISIVYSNEIGL